MSRGLAIAVHILLVGCQFLVPAFFPLTAVQQSAVSSFLAAVNAILGIQAYTLTPSGEKIGQSIVTTTVKTPMVGGAVATVEERHEEPSK